MEGEKKLHQNRRIISGKTMDVTALGELLIDFTESGVSAQGNPLLEANPGGAPCNVLAMLCRLGRSTRFIGKIGQDFFGDQLQEALQTVGIGTQGLLRDPGVHTTLAFVHNSADGDRDFSFYRNPGADMMLCSSEIREEWIADSKIFHFGTLSMTHEGCREATKKAVETAQKTGTVISFDPNLREPLWDSLDLAREQTDYGLRHCSILKISDNEIQWFTGQQDYEEGIRMLRKKYGIPLILVSLGRDGSIAFSDDVPVRMPAFLNPDTVDTTGAGDTFGACVLHYVLQHPEKELHFNKEELSEMLSFANAAASVVTTRKGALKVMPSEEEIRAVRSGSQTRP